MWENIIFQDLETNSEHSFPHFTAFLFFNVLTAPESIRCSMPSTSILTKLGESSIVWFSIKESKVEPITLTDKLELKSLPSYLKSTPNAERAPPSVISSYLKLFALLCEVNGEVITVIKSCVELILIFFATFNYSPLSY